MALAYADRVLETTTSTGTGALTLGGALTGYQAFSDALTNADTVYYSVFAVDGSGNPSGDWETGLGTYSSGTLTRTTVQDSSNAGSAVDFSAGTKWVMATPTAAVFTAPQSYILPFFFTSTPTDSELLFIHVAGADFTIPANFASALQSYVGTNPTATFDLDIAQNGTSIGTISVSTGGVVTATTTSGAAKSISAGDRLTATAQATADATAADMAFTIVGVR